MKDPFLAELDWRGLLHQVAGQNVEEHLKEPRIAYVGFDPTADSLTFGNLIPIKMLMHWQRAGHTPIIVMGGGTGLIGDPSGKDAERQLDTREQVAKNVERIREIFDNLLDFDPALPNAAILVDNLDWLLDLGYIQVLRDVGKHFSVNVMTQKDSVRDRLHNRDQGMSYTEFSYMVLQAYDFLHLRRTRNCTVQMAGSDQYGNIIEGMDLIRRELGAEKGRSYGITAPLVTRSDGKKIGKTESGAVWLTRERTSPYAFYQYWINISDDDVVKFLKLYTFLDQGEISAVEEQHAAAPHRRVAQRTLAESVTEMIHGPEELVRVQAATEALFGQGDVRAIDAGTLDDMLADVPASEHPRTSLDGEGMDLVELLAQTTLASSKRQAREFLSNGAVAVNGEKVGRDEERRLVAGDLLHGKTIMLKRGKKLWHATTWV